MSTQQTVEGHILVVDDQDNWRLALRILLEGEGFCVSEASGFQKAKDVLAESAFDVVVLDVRLVDEDTFNIEGLELLRIVRADFPSTRVIILTGYPDSLKRGPEADALVFKVPDGSTFDSVGFKSRVRELVEDAVTRRLGNT